MNHISVFLNSYINDCTKESFSPLEKMGTIGNWCLTPVHILFKGKYVFISSSSDQIQIEHERVYGMKEFVRDSFLVKIAKVALSFILIFPSLVIGCSLKGLSYLSKSVRDNHQLAMKHYYETIDITIGSEQENLEVSLIEERLKEEAGKNYFKQKAIITIYPQKHNFTNFDLYNKIQGLFDFKKVIVVGAKAGHPVNKPYLACLSGGEWEHGYLLNDEKKFKATTNLTPDCESALFSETGEANNAFLVQWKASSIEVAKSDPFPHPRFYYVKD